jgi:hypothetical protein
MPNCSSTYVLIALISFSLFNVSPRRTPRSTQNISKNAKVKTIGQKGRDWGKNELQEYYTIA